MATDYAQYEQEVRNYFNTLPKSSFEDSQCIFCKDKSRTAFMFKKGTMMVHRCECGFVFNKTQPTIETLNNFYSKSDAMTSWSNIKKTDKEIKRQDNKFESILFYLENLKFKSILDIGCGTGHFLKTIKNNFKDVQISGIDQNLDSCKVAKDNGVYACNASIEAFFRQNKDNYDLISLWGVLEHHKDPIWLLKECAKRTKRIIICVPNVASAVVQQSWEKCFTFCPQHLWYFDFTSLRKAIEASGFDGCFVKTIESESIPFAKSLFGFGPYDELPGWLDKQIETIAIEKKFEDKICEQSKGYKIVSICKKINS